MIHKVDGQNVCESPSLCPSIMTIQFFPTLIVGQLSITKRYLKSQHECSISTFVGLRAMVYKRIPVRLMATFPFTEPFSIIHPENFITNNTFHTLINTCTSSLNWEGFLISLCQLLVLLPWSSFLSFWNQYDTISF